VKKFARLFVVALTVLTASHVATGTLVSYSSARHQGPVPSTPVAEGPSNPCPPPLSTCAFNASTGLR